MLLVLSFMGVTSALVFANLGAAYGTAKSGVGIASMGVGRPDVPVAVHKVQMKRRAI